MKVEILSTAGTFGLWPLPYQEVWLLLLDVYFHLHALFTWSCVFLVTQEQQIQSLWANQVTKLMEKETDSKLVFPTVYLAM